jgi:microcystin-dependent protein
MVTFEELGIGHLTSAELMALAERISPGAIKQFFKWMNHAQSTKQKGSKIMALVEAYVGEIRLFAGTYAPRGWAFCEGQLLPIDRNSALFALLGTTYGGDGRTSFALPDLRGRAPIHPDRGDRGPGRRAGGQGLAAGSDAQLPATLTLNYIICLQGVFPDRP